MSKVCIGVKVEQIFSVREVCTGVMLVYMNEVDY